MPGKTSCPHRVLRPTGKRYEFSGDTVMTPTRQKLQGREILDCISCHTSLTPKIALYVFPRLKRR